MRQIDIFDIQSEQESIAISNGYTSNTMDFGKRARKTSIIPASIEKKISRKVCHNRNSRQIDLIKHKYQQQARELKNREKVGAIKL